jgi:hypothetical protein
MQLNEFLCFTFPRFIFSRFRNLLYTATLQHFSTLSLFHFSRIRILLYTHISPPGLNVFSTRAKKSLAIFYAVKYNA